MTLWNLLCTGLMAATLHTNDRAPDFVASDCDGKPQALAKLLQKGPVIIAFFPKAFTPGCTQELKVFTQSAEQLQKYSTQVLAISSDKAPVLQKFRDELRANYVFIPDPDGRLMQLYGVKTPMLPFAKRTTFVLDRTGKIVRIDTGQDAVRVHGALDVLSSLNDTGLPASP